MDLSIEAIQYVDPYWLKVAPGRLLWPSIAYFFGLDNDLDDFESTDKKSNPKSDNNEIADGII